MLADEDMLHNRRKIEACVQNARVMQEIGRRNGSFAAYLGEITVYHFLTDMGFSVLKPDRVIARLFQRLGLID